MSKLQELSPELISKMVDEARGGEKLQTPLFSQLTRKAIGNSYSPYSKFRVACSLLAEDGSLYTGVNVENAAYSPGICAERCAIVKAVSEGHRRFKAVMITSDVKDSFTSPCGVCRQTLREFAPDMWIMMCTPDKRVEKKTLGELLPMGFGPDDLELEKSK